MHMITHTHPCTYAPAHTVNVFKLNNLSTQLISGSLSARQEENIIVNTINANTFYWFLYGLCAANTLIIKHGLLDQKSAGTFLFSAEISNHDFTGFVFIVQQICGVSCI